MDNDQGSKLRYLYAMGALGILCLVGSIWLITNRQPASVVPASGIGVGKTQKLPHQIRKPQNTPARPNVPLVVLPIRSGIPGAGASLTPERPSMEVCLVDAATKLPVISGRISIREGHSGQALGEYEFNHQNCVLFRIDPGSYLFQAGGDGYLGVEQSMTVNSNDDGTRKVFSLLKRVLVHGIVRNSAGRPQPGACVSLFQETYHVTVRSDAGGHFEVELSSPEIQRVYAFRPPHPIAIMGPAVIRESKNPNLEITLPEDSVMVNISGTVSDDIGRPVEGAEVTVIPTSTHHVPDKKQDATLQGLQQTSARSDAQGRFSLEALPQNQAQLTVAGVKGCEVAGESIVLKEDVVRDIRLKCHPTFNVFVEKEDGSTVADAVIVAESPEGDPAILPTPEEGRYFARAYPFRIFAWTRWPSQDGYGITRSEWIKSYRDPVRLVLGHARVDGVVRDMSGSPVRSFSVRVIMADTVSRNISFPFKSEDGSFSLKYLPPGTATLQVKAEVTLPDGTRTPASFSEEVMLVGGQSVFLPAVLIR